VLVLVFGGVDEVAAIRSRSSCTKLDKFGVAKSCGGSTVSFLTKHCRLLQVILFSL
jgi:hypothetical protein